MSAFWDHARVPLHRPWQPVRRDDMVRSNSATPRPGDDASSPRAAQEATQRFLTLIGPRYRSPVAFSNVHFGMARDRETDSRPFPARGRSRLIP